MTRRRRFVVAAFVVAMFATAATALVAVTRGPAEPPKEFWDHVKVSRPGEPDAFAPCDGPNGKPVDIYVGMGSEMMLFCSAQTPWWNNWFVGVGLPATKPAWTATYVFDGDLAAFDSDGPIRYVLVEDSVVR